MANILKATSTHAGQLEQWLGGERVNLLSHSMTDWYGPPIAVAGVPGRVYAHKGGDFRGQIASRHGIGMEEHTIMALSRQQTPLRKMLSETPHGVHEALGFTGLDNLIARMSNGGRQEMPFLKGGSTGVVAGSSTFWRGGTQPIGGSTPPVDNTGVATTSSTTGAFPFINAASGNSLHFVNGQLSHTVTGMILLYDRLFHVGKTMASTGAQAISGAVQTRYASTTSTDPDYIGGNFGFIEVGGTQLAATGHNWASCTYTDQANAASTLPSVVGNSGAIVDRLDQPLGQWFVPLASGDTGIKAWTNIQCDASVATGLINFVIGRPIAWLFAPSLYLTNPTDGVYGVMSLTRVFDNACLSFMSVMASATTAPSITGSLTLCST